MAHYLACSNHLQVEVVNRLRSRLGSGLEFDIFSADLSIAVEVAAAIVGTFPSVSMLSFIVVD